ncbi:MAG: hypothetical protein JST65_17760 [Acidobacteria bacterium]|nr:hypothetical protein [Acidobacteriota bacterium]
MLSILTIGSDAGCPAGEIARIAAQKLGFEYVGTHRLEALLREEFGQDVVLPAKAWAPAVESVLSRLAVEHHLVACFAGCEQLFPRLALVTRIQLRASDNRRIGNLMIERRLDRGAAKAALRELDAGARALRKQRFGRATAPDGLQDAILNTTHMAPEQLASCAVAVVEAKGAPELLSQQAEAHLRFQSRLQLASHGITANGKAMLPGRAKLFGHPSEETFANLLDFYRVAWDYEPRSFPLQWDKEGKVLEAFTPDFYLPEFDLYVELTTMKQALVTRKNRKVKMLKAIYPQVNIQIFYQKDYQDLIGKYAQPHPD